MASIRTGRGSPRRTGEVAVDQVGVGEVQLRLTGATHALDVGHRGRETGQVVLPEQDAWNPLIGDHIGPFYVYLLVDPATDRPFYVGKGTGQRYRSHGREALLQRDPEMAEQAARPKLARIKAIREAGDEPRIVFARIQIPSADEAYLVEAALIDVLARYDGPLVNAVRGHDTDTGLIELEELERRLAAPELTTPIPAVLIKLSGWVSAAEPDTPRMGHGYRTGMTNDELYQSVRAWWVLDPTRAKRYRYVVAVHDGITRGVWAVDPAAWQAWSRPDRTRRWAFDGVAAPADIHEAFVGRIGRRVPHRRHDGRAVFGSANPIGYWPT